MKRRTYFTVAAALIGSSLLIQGAEARTCTGKGDVVGSYGFVGSRDGFFLLGATAPGSNYAVGSGPLIPVAITPPGTVIGSKTPIGNLIAGLSNPAVFSATGRLSADGLGNLFASSASLGSPTLAGTYTVNADCSITMTLTDPFLTSGSGTGGTTTGASVSLVGTLVDVNSNEIDLVSTGSSSAGAVVTLTKTTQFSSCTNASLSSNYGVSGQGMYNATGGNGIGIGGGTTATGAFTSGVTGTLGTAFSLLGRFVADGAGNFIQDFAGTGSPVQRSITGTYLVSPDCTGTGRFIDSAGVSRNISFVLVNQPGGSTRPELDFAFTDPGVFGGGVAKQQ
jgi:hypothetical protein